jgi:hypothetical protein
MKLRKFGEMFVITTKDEIQSKSADKGTTCMFVGYGVDHASDVYRFLNPNTERIIKSRDVIWLGKSFGTWTKSRNEVKIDKIDDSDDEEEVKKDTQVNDEEEVKKDTQVNDEVEGVKKRKLKKNKEGSIQIKALV